MQPGPPVRHRHGAGWYLHQNAARRARVRALSSKLCADFVPVLNAICEAACSSVRAHSQDSDLLQFVCACIAGTGTSLSAGGNAAQVRPMPLRQSAASKGPVGVSTAEKLSGPPVQSLLSRGCPMRLSAAWDVGQPGSSGGSGAKRGHAGAALQEGPMQSGLWGRKQPLPECSTGVV